MNIKQRSCVTLLAGSLLLVGATAQNVSADPITVTALSGTLTALDLANALAAGAGGITINSATYIGADIASGTFAGGAGILPITSGILLTTGSVENVIGPNDESGVTTVTGEPGDAALTTLGGDPTFDASILEIGFTPTGNTVQFSYVFGSDEYLEFVDFGVNDVFGFFINGVNRAWVPGTSIPVSIDTINDVDNSGFYVDNPTDAPVLNTQLDGLTTLLSFSASVNPGVLNTLRLGIADGGDTLLDSAVFLQAGSFSSCGGPGQPPCNGGSGTGGSGTGGSGTGGSGQGGSGVPEPASMALFGLAIAGALGRRYLRGRA